MVELIHGDCLKILEQFPDNYFSATICDPPYGLSKDPDIREVMLSWLDGQKYSGNKNGFMGKEWDAFVPGPRYWEIIYKKMKPGAYLLAFSSTRTWDLLSIAIRFAGFENRDTIASFGGPPAITHMQGQGFPKSHSVFKALKRMANNGHEISEGFIEAHRGSGTNLKPAWEVILVFRKPFRGTVAENVLEHGTGAINVDATRVPVGSEVLRTGSQHGEGEYDNSFWVITRYNGTEYVYNIVEGEESPEIHLMHKEKTTERTKNILDSAFSSSRKHEAQRS